MAASWAPRGNYVGTTRDSLHLPVLGSSAEVSPLPFLNFVRLAVRMLAALVLAPALVVPSQTAPGRAATGGTSFWSDA